MPQQPASQITTMLGMYTTPTVGSPPATRVCTRACALAAAAAMTTARYLLLYILANRLVDFPVLNHDISAPTSGDIRRLEQSGRRKTSSAAHCGRDGETEHTAIKTRSYHTTAMIVCCRHRHVQRDTIAAALEAEKQ